MPLRPEDNNDGWGFGTDSKGNSLPHPGSLPEPDSGLCNPRKIKDHAQWEKDRVDYEKSKGV